MKNNYNPIIIVVGFNRVHSLQRILKSLVKGFYPSNTRLVISIDNNGQNQNVAVLANDFIWAYGEKEVIHHPEHLGLRKHIIKCGDMIYDHGSAIILEDDLVVSPYFYKYAVNALNYYSNHNEIGGISLYNLPYTEALKQPFIPLKDDSDVYFKQVPSSLGQAWTIDQWDAFKKWYSTDPDIKSLRGLPPRVRANWPESSWKKYFYGFLVEKNKYFVFPQNSFTSNFNDLGENMKKITSFGQMRLEIVDSKYKFKTLDESFNVYDAYSEIIPDRLKILQPKLKDYDFEVDLYNKKEVFEKEYILTSKFCKNKTMNFGRAMKPIEMNIINEIAGDVISLAKSEDVVFRPLTMNEFEYEYAYFYKDIFDTNILFKIIINRIKNKIKSMFK